MLENVQKSIQLIAVAFGIFIPCVVFAGYVYYIGYVITFGLDPSLVARSLSDVVSEGWYLGILALGYILKFWKYPLLAFGILCVVFLVIIYVAAHFKSKGKPPFSAQITKENPGRKILGLSQWHWICWWELVETFYAWLLYPIAFLLVPILVMVNPYERGKQDAQRQIEELASHKCDSLLVKKGQVRCVELIDVSQTPNKVLFEGMVITANSNRIALYNSDDLEVWPLTDSVKIRKHVVK